MFWNIDVKRASSSSTYFILKFAYNQFNSITKRISYHTKYKIEIIKLVQENFTINHSKNRIDDRISK